MHSKAFAPFFLATMSFLLTPSYAANHDIQVGPALSFSQNTTSASPGDTLTFHFHPGKHNVAQSLFSSPCVASPAGFYSTFIIPPLTSDTSLETFIVTVNNTDPIWFYCSEYMHCQLGMVGVVNPPSSGQTLSAYALAASQTLNSTTPDEAAGGVFSSASLTSSPSSTLPSTSALTSVSSSGGTGMATGTGAGSAPAQATSAGVVLRGGSAFLNGMAAVVALGAVWAGLI